MLLTVSASSNRYYNLTICLHFTQGDDLDAKIRKTEKEVRALENTLRLMNGRNDKLRKTVKGANESPRDLAEKADTDAKVGRKKFS